MITLKAVLWDLDDTLYSRRDAVRQLFPGLLRACLYTDRSDEFIREAVEFLMTQIKGNRMICETAFRALLFASFFVTCEDAKAYMYSLSSRRRVHNWKDFWVNLYI